MQVLITGKGGKSGSWKVRGEQLGAAIGAEVQALAEPSDCRSADVVVCVKRTPTSVLQAVRASGRPLVWDIVDAWPQPQGLGWDDRSRAIDWLRGEIDRIKPFAIVFPTDAMREDAQFEGPALVLPHHAWGRYTAAPVRPAVRSVGYEGAEAYLGRWRSELQRECDRRGWRFVVNGDMADCDIGLALRDGGGYPAAHWKPNTKLANLQALGLPALCSPEKGYQQFASGSEVWIRKPSDIGDGFDQLADHDTRARVSVAMQEAAPRLADVARSYVAWLRRLRS